MCEDFDAIFPDTSVPSSKRHRSHAPPVAVANIVIAGGDGTDVYNNDDGVVAADNARADQYGSACADVVV